MSDSDKPIKKAPPSFDGMGDFDIDIGPMDDGNDTTRRAGGGISFAPISPFAAGPSTFDPSSRMTTASKQSAGVAPVTTRSNIAPFVWKLRDIPTLPEFHPLERTAVFVEGSSASEVSQRISDVLRERSIEAVYENEKAKAKCISAEGVEFRVRLYRGRGKYSRGIIVEVQRRFGTSVNFQGEVNAILSAAEGKVPPPPPSLGSSDAIPMVSDTEDDYTPPSGADSLKMVQTMLRGKGYDTHYLALQTLSSLTDSKKMGLATAKSVSKELLSGSNEVGAKVFDLLSADEEEDVFKLRVLALSILANALDAIQGKIHQVVRELLRPILLGELRDAETNPRSAQTAARCFSYLYKGDHDQGEIIAALEKARDVGQARHSGLQRQAQSCLDKML